VAHPLPRCRGMIAHDAVAFRSILRPGDTLPVLANTGAGDGDQNRARETAAALSRSGFDITWLELEPADLPDAAREWVRRGVKAIAVAGGDGSISAVARVLLDTGVVLVPVPLGTMNHFAKRYGMESVEAVTQALADGIVVPVSAGMVDQIAFVNNASIGYYPHLVRHRERLRRWFGKWTAAVLAGGWVLLKLPPIELEVTVDGRTIRRHTVALWIGIGRNSLRLPLPGDAAHRASVLELVLPTPTSRIALIALALRVWLRLRRRQPPSDSQLEILQGERVHIASRRPIDIATDGEAHRLPSPIEVEHRPAALHVLGRVDLRELSRM